MATTMMLMFYALFLGIIILAGIIVVIIGYGKEQKNLKLAGAIIAGTGIKLLILLVCYAWFLNAFTF